MLETPPVCLLTYLSPMPLLPTVLNVLAGALPLLAVTVPVEDVLAVVSVAFRPLTTETAGADATLVTPLFLRTAVPVAVVLPPVRPVPVRIPVSRLPKYTGLW